MLELCQSLSHSQWDSKCHVVFVPKRRRKAIFGQTRRHLRRIFQGLARQKECQILEGHLLPDHVHMCIAIPPNLRFFAPREDPTALAGGVGSPAWIAPG